MSAQPITDPRLDRPQLKRIRVHGERVGALHTKLQVRDFSLHTDEPIALGGTDSAPTPMEYVIAALEGCLAVVVETVAAEQERTLHSLTVDAAATMDTRGFAGVAGVRPHFLDVTVDVRASLTGDPAANGDLIAETERRCPAVNLIRDAGVDVTSSWTFETVAGGNDVEAIR